MTRVIGICGGIGSGKSVVSRALRCMGHPVYDCDIRARDIMDASESLKRDIASCLGPECVHDDGSLDRKAIARRVFADNEALQWLNIRVHALVRADILDWIEELEHRGIKLAFVESAIIASSGVAELCEELWLVDAPEEMRIKRAAIRDNASPDQIRMRIKAQEREMDLISHYNSRRIVNDGETPLIPQIQV